jgi:hypothetical protein
VPAIRELRFPFALFALGSVLCCDSPVKHLYGLHKRERGLAVPFPQQPALRPLASRAGGSNRLLLGVPTRTRFETTNAREAFDRYERFSGTWRDFVRLFACSAEAWALPLGGELLTESLLRFALLRVRLAFGVLELLASAWCAGFKSLLKQLRLEPDG